MIYDNPVQVYRNLHKDCWSVRDKKTRRVIAHCDSVILKDAKFKVSEKGRQRVIKEKRKNVHAFVEGTLSSAVVHDEDMHYVRRPEIRMDGGGWDNRNGVKYNPYKLPHFYYGTDLEEVHAAKYVELTRYGKVNTYD